MALACGAMLASAGTATAREQVIQVPGFADFIAVDGATVWVTNRGRVEHWSRTGKLAEVPMEHPCGAMAITAGSLWVADCKDKTLNRIDLKTAKRTAVVATGIGSPNGEMNVVAGAGSVWVASDAKGVIARVNPRTNRVVASVKVDPDTTYLAYGLGSLWAVSLPQRSVSKISPRTNAVVKRTPVGRDPGFLAAGEGAVWVQEQGDGTVARIDPGTGEVSGRVKVGASLKYGDIDTGAGKVWLRTTDDQTIAELDPKSLTVTARIGAASGSGGLRHATGGVWTTAHDKHTLSWWDDLPTGSN